MNSALIKRQVTQIVLLLAVLVVCVVLRQVDHHEGDVVFAVVVLTHFLDDLAGHLTQSGRTKALSCLLTHLMCLGSQSLLREYSEEAVRAEDEHVVIVLNGVMEHLGLASDKLFDVSITDGPGNGKLSVDTVLAVLVGDPAAAVNDAFALVLSRRRLIGGQLVDLSVLFQ